MTKNILFILFFCFSAYGQIEAVNPKVVEVQESIKYDVKEYLGSVLPVGSFMVNVKIDPLRRGIPSNYDRNNSEALPYMQVNGEKVLDEWDDPQSQVYSLYNRVRNVKVFLNLSNEVNIKDMDKFKQDLFKSTELVAGRDNIEIKRGLNFTIEKPMSERLLSAESILAMVFCLILVVSMYLQSRVFKKIGQKIDSDVQATSSQNTVASAPPSGSAVSSSRAKEDSGATELSLSNPIILRDVIKDKLSELEKVEVFPLLTDMITLEQLAETNKEAFSFLVFEFPVDMQGEILKRGRTRDWLEAFSCSGQAHNSAIRALDQMMRNRKEKPNQAFEDFLIQMWRLGGNLESFISGMDRQFGIEVLSCLPKSDALPIARTLYPGDWGKVLDDNQNKSFDEVLIQREFQRAVDVEPYFDFTSLSQFRNQKDLLNYLKNCGIQEEKDVYVLRGEGDILERLRPPFYRFFELNDAQMAEVFFKFTLEEWAIAIFNSGRSYRDTINSILSEKQSYLLTEHLKAANTNKLNLQEKTSIKEKIAIAVDDVKKYSKIKGQDKTHLEGPNAAEAA